MTRSQRRSKGNEEYSGDNTTRRDEQEEERRPIGEEDSFGNETGEQRLPGEDERHADRLQFQFHRGQAEERTAENGRAQWKEE